MFRQADVSGSSFRDVVIATRGYQPQEEDIQSLGREIVAVEVAKKVPHFPGQAAIGRTPEGSVLSRANMYLRRQYLDWYIITQKGLK